VAQDGIRLRSVLKMSEAAVKLEEDAVANAAPDAVPQPDALEKSAAAKADEPAVAPAEPADDYLRKVLDEYDAAFPPQPPPAPAQPPPSSDAIDQLLAELSTPSPAERQQAAQLTALQSENAQLKGHLRYQADLADFEKLAGEVQSKLPAHIPEDYAAINFKAMAAERPEIALAFDLRYVDPRAASVELNRVQIALGLLQRDPLADPNRITALTQYAQRLNLARNSAAILRAARQEVIKRAERLRPPLDEAASADREAVAASVRSAGGRVAVEPAPQLGTMSNNELRKWTRDNFGYDPLL
jgi:hypothetical protein